MHRIRQFALSGTIAALTGASSLSEEVWINPASGVWSNPQSWLDGTAPPIGGDPALVLRFIGVSTAYVATNDLGAPFLLNGLAFDSAKTGRISLASQAGQSILFGGANPTISQNGTASVMITSDIGIASDSGPLTIGGSGIGSIWLGGAVSGSATPPKLVIAANPASPNVQRITLNILSGLTGGVRLDSGNLDIGPGANLGPVVVNGGTLRVVDVSTFTSNVILNANLVLSGTRPVSGVISSNAADAGIAVRNGSGATITLLSPNTYSGATTLDFSLDPTIVRSGGGSLILSGNGSVLNTSEINVRSGSTLRIGAVTTGLSDRVGNNTTINLASGQLAFDGVSSNSAQSEGVGAITGAGYSTVSVVPSTINAQLAAASLTRVNRGTFLFRGNQLGGAGTNSTARITLGTVPNGAVGVGDGAIFPFAIADTNSAGLGTTFVSYSATTGLRALATSEYTSTVTAGAPTSNVRVTGLETVAAARSINSLIVVGTTLNGNTISLESGALLANGNAVVNNALAFGGVEASIFATGTLTLAGNLTGTNGLTKSGQGSLTLSSPTALSGPLTINSGIVIVQNLRAIDNISPTIVLGGMGATFVYAAPAPFALNHALEIRSGIGGLGVSTSAGLTVTTPISGAGGMNFFAATGSLTLAVPNTFTGPAVLGGGVVAIPHDAALGAGSSLTLQSSSTLRLSGPWNSAREIGLTSTTSEPAAIDTGGFAASLSGPIIGTGSLRKSGAGTLTITQPGTFNGTLNAVEGALVLKGNGSLMSGSVVVEPGARIDLDHTAGGQSSRLPTAANLILGGEFRLLGAADTRVTQDLNTTIFSSAAPTSVITLTASGTGETILKTGTNSGAFALIRGTNLGGSPGAAFTRVVLPNLTPETIAARLTGVIVDQDATGLGDSFATYDFGSDMAGPIGLRAFRLEEYASGPAIRNPANGGTTPVASPFFAEGSVTAIGHRNEVGTLTMSPGASVELLAGQRLRLSGSGLLAQAGGASTISGGALEFSSSLARIHTASDLTISSGLESMLSLAKTGPGTLTISGPTYFGGAGLLVAEGALRPGKANALAGEIVHLLPNGAFDLGTLSASVGGLAGTGVATLGSQTLTLGTSPFATSFDGQLEGTGTLRIVDGGLPFALRAFNVASNFGGNVVLDSGRLSLVTGALGTGPIVANGGAIEPGASFVLDRVLSIPGTLAITGGNGLTIPEGVAVSGPGDLVFRGGGTLTIGTALALAGQLRTGDPVPGSQTIAAKNIVLSGPSGALPNVSEIRLERAARLVIDDTTLPTAGRRVSPDTALFVRGSTIVLRANGGAGAVEAFGATNLSGFNAFEIIGTTSATLRFDSIALEDHAGLLLTGAGLGGTAGLENSRIFVNTPPQLVGAGGTGPATSIVPWATGRSSGVTVPSSATFVTYSAETGFRPLAATEVPLFNAGNGVISTDNLRIGRDTTIHGTYQANAIAVTGGSISGAGVLRPNSGAIVDPVGTTIANPIDFGANPGYYHTPVGQVTVVLNGAISGTGGFAKVGPGTMTLAGDNTFTGGLSVHSGRIEFSRLANLGSDGAPIRITEGTLAYTGTEPLTIPRHFQISAATLSGPAAAPLTISGVISGSGGLTVPSGGALALPGANTFTGPTAIRGQLTIASDASLGSGGDVLLTGTLKLAGDWDTSRVLEIGTSSLDTGIYQATWRSPVIRSNSGSFTKSGAGTLTLTAASPFDGNFTVGAGTFRLEGAAQVGSLVYTVGSGARMVLDNRSLADSDRMADSASLSLGGGTFQIIGNAQKSVTERFGTVTIEGLRSGELVLEAAGSEPIIADIDRVNLSSSRFVVRGTDLGGAGANGFSRLIFRDPPTPTAGVTPATVVAGTSNLILADRGDGLGANLAVYDTTLDEHGPIGLRPLLNSEYATDFTQPNSATLHYRATGQNNVPASLASASVYSLTMSPGTDFILRRNQSLLVGRGGILTQAGSATLSGGLVVFGSNPVNLMGDGDLLVTSDFSGTGGFWKTGIGSVHLASPTRWNGTFNVMEGTLKVSPPTAFANASIFLGAEGAFELQGATTDLAALTGSGLVRLGSSRLRVRSSGTFAGELRGSGDFQVATGISTLSTPQSYTGVTEVGRAPDMLGLGTARLVLSNNATLLNTSGIVLSSLGTLEIKTGNGTNPITRLPALPVTSSGGGLAVAISLASPATVSFPSLTASGRSIIHVVPSGTANGSATLQFDAFERRDRGTLLLSRGNAAGNRLLFGSALAASLVGDGASATSTPILPFAVETIPSSLPSSTPLRLATYDEVSGVRPLDPATEMAQTLVTGQNVNLANGGTLSGNLSINALRIIGNLGGTGKLHVASGAVIVPSNALATTISVPIDFGAAEGNLFTEWQTSLDGAITGTNGVTFTGTGLSSRSTFVLGTSNSFLGPVTVNNATVALATLNSLGADTSPITLHDGTLALQQATAAALRRPIRTLGWQGAVRSANPLTLTDPITGPGGMLFGGSVAVLAANSYAGATVIEGAITIQSDAAFGQSPLVSFATFGVLPLPQIKLLGNWVTQRKFAGEVAIDTNGFRADLRGAFAASKLTKTGLGTMSILDPRGISSLVVSRGKVELETPVGVFGDVTVSGGATLEGGFRVTGLLTTTDNSHIALDLGGPVPGLYDQIQTGSGIVLSGSTFLDLSLDGYDPLFSDIFFLVTRDDAGAATGSFYGLFEGSTVNLGPNRSGRITYRANWTGDQATSTIQGGNDIAIYRVVPEPGVGMLISSALVLLFRRSRSSRG